jgi:uncharacterized glyoxalase superfamily protein PhnB
VHFLLKDQGRWFFSTVLEPVLEKLKEASVYLPVRTTFYGMKEIGVRDPAGHFIPFAAPPAQPAH